MLAFWRFTLTPCFSNRYRNKLCCKAQAPQTYINGGHNNNNNNNSNKKKVVIVGSGWAGLGAAHHLCNQGFDVTVLDGGNGFGSPDDVSIQGFWYPYRNIFNLVDELGIKPFTNWTKSAQYSEEGLKYKTRNKESRYHDRHQLNTDGGRRRIDFSACKCATTILVLVGVITVIFLGVDYHII